MATKAPRIYTGLTGLPVCEHPQRELSKIYTRVLRYLKVLPEDYQYRIITEKLIKERKAIVETTPDRDEIEKKIPGGLCEELIDQANQEIVLINTLNEHKAWEKLDQKPPQDQWKWPPL